MDRAWWQGIPFGQRQRHADANSGPIPGRTGPGQQPYFRLRVEVKWVQQIIDNFVRSRTAVRVLDAGCGYRSYFDFGHGVSVDGVDISRQQLARNTRLKNRICADVQALQLPSGQYDVIVCWDLLEHLPYPQRALNNFRSWVNQGGLVILAMPNVLSAAGLIGKLTPHWLHVWVYRHLLGDALAGEDGRGPFPIYMRLCISPKAICRWAWESEFIVERFSIFDTGGVDQILMRRHFFCGTIFRVFGFLLKLLSFGRVSASCSKCIVVLRKNAQ